MDKPEGAGSQGAKRVTFDYRLRLGFRGTQLSSGGGILVMRELDDGLGLSIKNSHYESGEYMSKKSWPRVWHQTGEMGH